MSNPNDDASSNPTGNIDTNANKTLMKSALVSKFAAEFGKVDDVLTLSTTTTKPSLSDEKAKKSSKRLLLRVLACSIAAGDTLMLSGTVIFLHPEKFPFVPGLEVCGIVEDMDEGVTEFKIGDIVYGNHGPTLQGGMREYTIVDSAKAVLKPEKVDIIQTASCASAMTALHSVDYVKTGDRVLVIGGSGGVGSAAISLSKYAGASFVAAVSTQKQMCEDLGAEQVINYNETNWWEVEEFTKTKFDIIIDCAGGKNNFPMSKLVLKPRKNGGRFIAVTGDEPRPKLQSWFEVIRYVLKMPIRPLWTILTGKTNPGYICVLPLNEINGVKRVLDLLNDGKLKIAMDPSSPLPFTEEGVIKAFNIQGSGHAHGKVTVKISDL